MKKLLVMTLALAMMFTAVSAFAASTGTITYIVDPEGEEDFTLTPRRANDLAAVIMILRKLERR